MNTEGIDLAGLVPGCFSPNYAKVGGPPSNWRMLSVIDIDTQQPIDFHEVNCSEGWAIVYVTLGDIANPNAERETKRIEGRFRTVTWI